MELIQTVTVGSGGAASISFTSIPQTYTDLYIVASIRNSSTFEHVLIGINGSTADFTGRYASGFGSSGQTSTGTYARYIGNVSRAGFTADTFGSTGIYIPNYRVSASKAISAESVGENNNASSWAMVMSANHWGQNTAISSIQLTNEGGATILEFSSASLYGITAGSDGVTTVS